MAAHLQISQVGLDAGGIGISRTDGRDDGSKVSLHNTGGGTTLMRILWTPPGDTTALGSLAPTEDPDVWDFDPTPKRYGTYLIELVRNEGLLSETSERRTFVVRTPGGLVIPALNERGNRFATLEDPGSLDEVDNNATDSPDPNLAALPFAAWWRALHELITAVDWSIAPVRVMVAHGNAGGARQRIAYRTIGEALVANYPSSHPSIAIYEIEPTVIDPIEEGPFTLDDDGAHYVLRAARGPNTGVQLPAMVSGNEIEVHGCEVHSVTGNATLRLFDCTVDATEFALSFLGLHRCIVWTATTVAVNGAIQARDTSFFVEALELTVESSGDEAAAIFESCSFVSLALETTNVLATFVDCTFAAASAPTVTFDTAGVVRMDARSKFLFDAAGGSVINGTITVEAPP
jgi:hypothetical protein